MVFFLYTGTFKLFQEFLHTSLNLTDQYDISIFISIQNRDYPLAMKYMKEQNFLIDLILSICGWLSNFPALFPWWKAIYEKLLGIQWRNKKMLEELLRQQGVYSNSNAPWNENITSPNNNNLPDDDWARPNWNGQWKPPTIPGGGKWQPRPPPGWGRQHGGTLYPPLSPSPLPQPPRGIGDEGRKPGDWGWKESPTPPVPPEPPSGWDQDSGPGPGWDEGPEPEEPGEPEPGPGGGLIPPGGIIDGRKRCGY